jgi:hypothetical protein
MRQAKHNEMTAARRFAVLLALVGIFAAFFAVPASAKKVRLQVETFGSAAKPTINTAGSLAIDRSTGDLLVVDTGAGTVSRYNPDGTPHSFPALGTNVIDAKRGAGGKECAEEPTSCDRTPQNGFGFSSVAGTDQIAVDNSGGVTDGDIYVTQGNQSTGNLVDIFASTGKYLGQITAAGATGFGTTGSFPFSPCGVAVSGNGDLFLGGGYDKKIYKFHPTGNPPTNGDIAETFDTGSVVCGLAVSGSSLFASTYYENNGNDRVFKYSVAGGALEATIIPPQGQTAAIATDPSNGHLFAGGTEFDSSGGLVSTFAGGRDGVAAESASKIYSSSGGSINVYGPIVTIPDVTTGAATITGDTSVRLSGTVNADGVLLEECKFEYGKAGAPYEDVQPCAETPAEIGTGTKGVHADLSALEKEAAYHYRLVAKNVNGTVSGSDQPFQTPSKPAIDGEWAADVGLAEATLKAEINPGNSSTTYRFEYGDQGPCDSNLCSQVPLSPEPSIGSDAVDHTVRILLDGLTPGDTYYYRVVATNGIGVTEGSGSSFTTFLPGSGATTSCANQAFRTGASAALPDCRAYEMVSPIDKNGGDIYTPLDVTSFTSYLYQSSVDGNRFTYTSSRAFPGSAAGAIPSQYIASRGAGGWATAPVSPPRDVVADGNLFFENEYQGFTADLSSGWLLLTSATPLVPGLPEASSALVRRENTGGSYEALAAAPDSLLSRELALQGYSADGSKAVFQVANVLTPDAASGVQQTYYASGGQLRLVCILPSGIPSGKSCSAGSPPRASGGAGGASFRTRYASLTHAISEDGSRVYWTADVGGGEAGRGRIYLRLNPGEPQSPLDGGGQCEDPIAACTLSVSTKAAQFWAGSADGSKALYSITEGPKSGDLNIYEADEETSTLIAHNVIGVAGQSEDLSHVYFVSTEVLSGANGEGKVPASGERNLYLAHEGTDTFVATLTGADTDAGEGPSDIATAPIFHVASSTSDGENLTFISRASLTGYDNRDANTGLADSEVYVYDALTGSLDCASCNPSGARPVGKLLAENENQGRLQAAATIPASYNNLTRPRVLSEDGNRLFFSAYDPLVPTDSNGKADVYEWERAGVGACQESDSSFSFRNDGCIALISSGENSSDSLVVDSSPDGRDVFFTTNASLLPQDPGLIDIYDAREEGGLPAPAGPPAGCEGEACQGPLSPPNDPTPASSTFRGAGNLVEKPTRKKHRKKAHRKKAHRKKAHKKKHKQARNSSTRASNNGRAGR